jgi:ADP-heptose:LPS heptosyltransferase
VNPVVLAGATSLEQIFALMERADVVISSDSGPLHIASSVGTPTIAIFGPTRPQDTGPRGKGPSVVLRKSLDCNQQACYQLDCPDNRCMKAVTVDEVSKEVEKRYKQWIEEHHQ